MLRAGLTLVSALVLAAPAAAVSLEDAIAAALAAAPEARAAEAGLDAARARLSQARGAALPTASISGTIGTGRLDPRGYFGLQASDVTPRAALATIEQPLFAGGRVNAARAAAVAGQAGAEASLAHTRARLAADVATAYAAILTAGHEVDLRRAQLAQMAEIERQASLRYKAGEAPSTDLSQARARRAEAEAGLAAATGEKAGAIAHFAALTGLEADALQPLPPPPAQPPTREAAIRAALGANPALAVAGRTVDAATAQTRAARADWLPTVGAFAEASMVRDQFFPDYTADQAVVGVRARWALFDGGRQGRIAEADANRRAAEAAREAARRSVQAETTAAYEAMTAARLMAEAGARREAAAAEALRATRLEVKVGMKPQLALLDAEREAIDAAVAAARARGALVAAGWRLKALTGA